MMVSMKEMYIENCASKIIIKTILSKLCGFENLIEGNKATAIDGEFGKKDLKRVEPITLPDLIGQISSRYFSTAIGCWKSSGAPESSECNISTGPKHTARLAGDILLH